MPRLLLICRSSFRVNLHWIKSVISGKLSGLHATRAFVNRLTMLVSAEGTWMLEDSAEFRVALGDPEPDYDGAAFAVKNLGFIKFQVLDNSIIEIDLHPHNIEIPALLAVQQQILTSKVKLFRLKYFDASWKSEIICPAELAGARLSELSAPKFALSAKDSFLVEPQDYLKLFE